MKPAKTRAAVDHVVSDAATSHPGAGTNTARIGDWLAEMSLHRSAKPADSTKAGVPISTRTPGDKRLGQGIESKRGQQ